MRWKSRYLNEIGERYGKIEYRGVKFHNNGVVQAVIGISA